MLHEEGTEDVAEELESEDGVEGAELSHHSVMGLDSPKTFKLMGRLRGIDVLVLVDSGATHNFLAQELVDKAGLTLQNKGFRVQLGDGSTVKGKGVCRMVEIELPAVTVKQDFFSLELGGVDVILGVSWLASLGEVKNNWKTQTMNFWHQGQRVCLKGDPSLLRLETSFKGIIKAVEAGDECFWLRAANVSTERVSPDDEYFHSLLLDFEQLFQDPKCLPPRREHDHAIRLVPGSQPPNLRPYHSPHFQKDEIERLVREMLAAGVIRPSVSPYSSPVLLVRKKDGGWRFCVDYRALNSLTVPDKFPIPAIDELLDELGKAVVVFSKLDLNRGTTRSGYCKKI